MDCPIPFEGKIEFPLYRSAQLLHMGWKKYIYIVIPVLVGSAYALQPHYAEAPFNWPPIIGVILVIPFLLWSLNRTWKKVFKATPYFKYQLKGEFTDEGYFVENEQGQALIKWGDFTGAKANKRVMIIYQGPVIFHMICSSFFHAPQQWEATKDFIFKKVSNKVNN